MMSRYKCSKCGIGAISKCVKQRSVFLDDLAQRSSLAGMLISTDYMAVGPIPRYGEGMQESPHMEGLVTITVKTFVPFGEEMSKVQDDSEKQAFEMIQSLDKDTTKYYLCDHDWQITEGECLFGCCIHQD